MILPANEIQKIDIRLKEAKAEWYIASSIGNSTKMLFWGKEIQAQKKLKRLAIENSKVS